MIKLIHMSTAFISLSLFLLRGYWVFTHSIQMNKKWVKIIPHINDTVLLVSAIILAISIQQYPFSESWLTAKFTALLLYIILGMFALKRAKNMKNKMLFFILALITYSYILMVAMTRNMSGIF